MYSILSPWILRTKRVESIGLSLAFIQGLSCLKELRMTHCYLSYLPSEIGRLIWFETLDLDGNNLHTLPDSIINLTRLDCLSLIDCARLHSLPQLPVSLRHMEAYCCTSLEIIFIESGCQGEQFMCSLG